MGKLRETLMDPSRAGVYRVSGPDEVVDAAQGSGLALARVDLRQPVFDAFARALAFPDWFGRNWDALEDCLTDLSWRDAAGYVLLLEGVAKEERVLVDVLRSAAQFWAGQGRPFFAVFVDRSGRLALDDLCRGA
jgi:hypothetical protein